MRSEDEIFLNYQDAFNQLDELRSVECGLAAQIEKIDESRSLLRKNWEGENADAMSEKILRMWERTEEIKKELGNAITYFEQKITEIRDLDLQASRKVQNQ